MGKHDKKNKRSYSNSSFEDSQVRKSHKDKKSTKHHHKHKSNHKSRSSSRSRSDSWDKSKREGKDRKNKRSRSRDYKSKDHVDTTNLSREEMIKMQ
jgi:hypothetical protein